jgi:hypothetical protein
MWQALRVYPAQKPVAVPCCCLLHAYFAELEANAAPVTSSCIHNTHPCRARLAAYGLLRVRPSRHALTPRAQELKRLSPEVHARLLDELRSPELLRALDLARETFPDMQRVTQA